MTPSYFVHDTASIAPEAVIGNRTQIWQHCQVREGAVIGEECILGKGVYIDARVHIGSRVKIQNYVSVYEGVTMEDGVFCGPHCVFMWIPFIHLSPGPRVPTEALTLTPLMIPPL